MDPQGRPVVVVFAGSPARARRFQARLSAAAALVLLACGPTVRDPTLHAPGTPLPAPSHSVPFLKAHLHSGDVVLLDSWGTPPAGAAMLEGYGVRFDPQRVPGDPGPLTIPLDSIALLETNSEEVVGEFALAGLTIFSVLEAVASVACVADPKACFGSCPTFYAEGMDDRPAAEGFSSSFARILEDRDVDALAGVAPRDGVVTLTMRNEAPETHAVRGVRLLAVPRAGGRVLATADGRFFRASEGVRPVACEAEHGPCFASLSGEASEAYASAADPRDLAAREEVIVTFPSAGPGPAGVLLRARHSLLSTFLFYQTIAYLGEDAGAWLAALERGNPETVERSLGLARELGNLEVEVSEGGGPWRRVGSFGETGPIAADEQVIPFHARSGGPLRLRLRMAKGHWRLARVDLVRLGAEVEPLRLDPVAAEPVGIRADPEALARLLDPQRHLVTQRGDAYRLRFELPPGGGDGAWAFFLESEGYYYEWMRREWGGERDPWMAALIFTDPAAALRRLAPAFKEIEADMETTFWSSRFRGEGR